MGNRQIHLPKVWIQDGYFSYDKIHIDNWGFKGIKKRSAHLACLFRSFDTLAEEISNLNRPFQIWILIHEKSSHEDCIILHSPNSISSFPHRYENLTTVSNFKDTDLKAFIEKKQEFTSLFGTSFEENDAGKQIQENFCILFKPALGETVV